MERIDLSARYMDMKEVSLMLEKRAKAPKGLMLEVGEYAGRFYQLDWMANKVSRLTLGAFQHLHNVWKAQSSFDYLTD